MGRLGAFAGGFAPTATSVAGAGAFGYGAYSLGQHGYDTYTNWDNLSGPQRVSAIGVPIAGLAGGYAGYQSVSPSTIASWQNAGASSRLFVHETARSVYVPFAAYAQRVNNSAGMNAFNLLAGFAKARSAGYPRIHSSLQKLSDAGRAADKGGLTRAGRAAQKHGSRPSDTLFPPQSGSPQQINAAGQNILDDILTHPNSIRSSLGRGGTKVTHPDGRGARFDADGRFSGFVQ